MPRPKLPKTVPAPKLSSFPLDERAKKRIAAPIGVEALPPKTVSDIERVTACYLATQKGSKTTTTGNVLRVLRQLEGSSKRAQWDAIEVLADRQSGIDSETSRLLYPLAKRVVEGDVAAKALLIRAARHRAATLETYPRVATSTEPFRHFCGELRVIFNECTCHYGWAGIDPEEAWHRCRQFAMEIFDAAGIEHNFHAHPERLKQYLGTDVSTDQPVSGRLAPSPATGTLLTIATRLAASSLIVPVRTFVPNWVSFSAVIGATHLPLILYLRRRANFGNS
jgi:hypothetical protein